MRVAAGAKVECPECGADVTIQTVYIHHVKNHLSYNAEPICPCGHQFRLVELRPPRTSFV